MPAAEYNFSIEKGSIFSIAFEYKDSNLIPINLTNWCARFNMQSTDTDKPITLFSFVSDKTLPEYSFNIVPSEGKIVLILPVSTTESLNFNNAKYDLDLKAPNEVYPGAGPQIIKLLKGFISIISSNVEVSTPFDCNISSGDPCQTCE
jgi:hypothetical protein